MACLWTLQMVSLVIQNYIFWWSNLSILSFVASAFGVSIPSSDNRRGHWHPTPVLSPGKSHGWRNLVGCSPWGRTESDMTERLHFHFSLSCIGEGNGNPLQHSYLENPMDRGAWQARTGLSDKAQRNHESYALLCGVHIVAATV